MNQPSEPLLKPWERPCTCTYEMTVFRIPPQECKACRALTKHEREQLKPKEKT